MLSFIIGPARHVLATGGSLGRVPGGIFGGVGRWLRARRDYHRLCDMSERDLRDLGLRDCSERDRIAAPFFGDPTGIIAMRCEERRGLAGGESLDEALRSQSSDAPAQLEERTGNVTSSRVVFLRAVE
ncbi:DUF1127 domain-containing protein [Bosea rubneri]|uniref:DUF1127 domain-containing protein n=1 Tax=Bosea rubneri TaxID=3075434 RepID=A0ABU3S431_9HYPH|nr:DUF1127 domain-containing protein [Bosea sp. ZW T0_25]MDU0339533.1 DUF1127 domain-containing protein [Bosea sp. ZW T0_25]